MNLENYIVIIFTAVFYIYMIYSPVPQVDLQKLVIKKNFVQQKKNIINQSTIDKINSSLKKNGLNTEQKALYCKEIN